MHVQADEERMLFTHDYPSVALHVRAATAENAHDAQSKGVSQDDQVQGTIGVVATTQRRQ